MKGNCNNEIIYSKKISLKKTYDVIVCGGGVAGVAAAVSAAKIFSAGSIKVIWKLGKAFSITVKNSVCKRICAAVRQANFRFTKKNAKIVNGALIQINTADCGIMPEVALLIKIAIPLAPPIVKSLAEISE